MELFNLKRYDEALAAFDRVLALDPKGPNASNTLTSKASALYSLGRYQESLDTFDRVLIFDPHNAKLWQVKAKILEKLGRPEEAQSAHEHALTLDSNDTAGAWLKEGYTLF